MRTKALLLLSLISGWSYANINVTEGSGKTVATDSVAGTEYQKLKVCDGTAGSSVCFSTVPVSVAASTVGAHQEGTWTDTVTQSVDASLNASVSLKGSSNTVVLGAGAQTIGAISNTGFNVNNSPTIANTGFAVTNAPTVVISTNGVNSSTTAIVNAVGTNLSVVFPSAQSVSVSNAPTVVLSTGGVNSSTTAITNAVGTTIAISGSISNTGFNVNNTPAVTGSGLFNTTSSTNGVVNGGTPFQTANSTNSVVSSVDSSLNASVSIKASSNTVNVSTPTYGQAFPAAGMAAGIKGDFGEMISQRGQSSSSATYTYQTNISTFVGSLSNNGAAATSNMVADLPAVAQNQYASNGTAYTQGRNVALNIGTNDGGLRTTMIGNITDRSYSASTTTFAMVASTADITAICGNIFSTVTVTGLRLSCTETTAGIIQVAVDKRSSGYVAAWSTITAVSEDSNYAINNSTAIFFTAFPHASDGTLVGHLDSAQIGCLAAATTSANDIYISPASWRTKPIVLRTPSQCIGVNVQDGTVTGNKWNVTWQWTETNSP